MSELKSLGKEIPIPFEYKPEVLESFENKHPENEYWVKFRNLPASALLPGSLILQPYTSAIYRTKSLWKVKA